MATAMVLEGEVRSTSDLQKKTKAVLDTASERPVLIHREDQKGDIALLNLSLARRMSETYHLARIIEAAFRCVLARVRADDAKSVSYPVELAWMQEFDNDDLLECADEIGMAFERVITGDRPATAVTDIIEQWRRSAMVLRDGALRERLEQERSIILEGAR
jgi:hypothetical protein